MTKQRKTGRVTMDHLRTCLSPVFRRYQVSRAIVFGSLARGEASGRSDVDLILVQRTSRRFLDRYDGLLYELNMALPEATLDVLIYTPDELERIKHRCFIATALREGQVIYEFGRRKSAKHDRVEYIKPYEWPMEKVSGRVSGGVVFQMRWPGIIGTGGGP